LYSGIAALLIPGGRTAHSRFAIPINIHETSTCEIPTKVNHTGWSAYDAQALFRSGWQDFAGKR
jgi:hypothetical protein